MEENSQLFAGYETNSQQLLFAEMNQFSSSINTQKSMMEGGGVPLEMFVDGIKFPEDAPFMAANTISYQHQHQHHQQQQQYIPQNSMDMLQPPVSLSSSINGMPFVNPTAIIPDSTTITNIQTVMLQGVSLPSFSSNIQHQDLDEEHPTQQEQAPNESDLPELNFSDLGNEFLTQFSSQGSLPNQNSGTISQEEIAIPSIEPWAGDYKFSMTLEKGATRKFAYSTERNKLYCVPEKGIEFYFSYDYNKCINSKMSLRCFLRYTLPQQASIPVRRCDFHISKEKKSDTSGSEFDEETHPAYHVMKIDSNVNNKKPKYYKGQNDNRFYVQVPIGKPQAGTKEISQIFKFDCSQTCKPDSGVTRSPITAVIELFKDKKPVGRTSFEVRVCSCPVRDFTKEEPEHADGLPKLAKRKKKTKNEDNNSIVVSDEASCAVNKVRGKSFPLKTTDFTGDSILEDLPTAKKRRVSAPPVAIKSEAVPGVLDDSDTDPLFSSQESATDDPMPLPENRKEDVKQCLKMAKFVLKLRYNSPDDLDQYLAVNLKGEIKRAFNTYRSRREKAGLSFTENVVPNNNGNDSGVGPAQ